MACKLKDGEPVDVYLAHLRRLAELFGGMTDTGLRCAFVAGLPEPARHTLRAGSWIESMDINQLLHLVRAVLVDDSRGTGMSTYLSYVRKHADSSSPGVDAQWLACNQPNHYARDCLTRRKRRSDGCGMVCCFKCGQRGDVASRCSGNASGEEESASDFSLGHQ